MLKFILFNGRHYSENHNEFAARLSLYTFTNEIVLISNIVLLPLLTPHQCVYWQGLLI